MERKVKIETIFIMGSLLLISCGKKEQTVKNQTLTVKSKNKDIKVKTTNNHYYQSLFIEGKEIKIDPSSYKVEATSSAVLLVNKSDNSPVFSITLEQNIKHHPYYNFNQDDVDNNRVNIYIMNKRNGRPLKFSYKGGHKNIKKSYEILDQLMTGFYSPESAINDKGQLLRSETIYSIKSPPNIVLGHRDINIKNKDFLKIRLKDKYDQGIDEAHFNLEIDRGFTYIDYKKVESIEVKSLKRSEFIFSRSVLNIGNSYKKISYTINHNGKLSFLVNSFISTKSLENCVVENFEDTVLNFNILNYKKSLATYRGEIVLRNDVFKKCGHIDSLKDEITVLDSKLNDFTWSRSSSI